MKKLFKALKNRKGFTIVELMAVIVILGVIAAIAAPRVMGSINKSKEKADEANRKVIKQALERLYVDEGNKWPTWAQEGVADGITNAELQTYLGNNLYLKSVPKDPQTDTDAYTATANADGSASVKCTHGTES